MLGIINMRISKSNYKDYLKWHEGRITPAPLRTIEYDYKGGRLWVMPNPRKRAIDVGISYNGVRYGKTFEVPCDIVWRENRYGLFGSIVKYEKEYRWRDIETIKIAEEFAKSMLDGLDLLSQSKETGNKEIKLAELLFTDLGNHKIVDEV